jgi:hypothetical protein
LLSETIAGKKDDDELMKEIKKIRETINKKSFVPPVVTAPAPKKKTKKAVGPIVKETNVSDLLHRMGKIEIVRKDD